MSPSLTEHFIQHNGENLPQAILEVAAFEFALKNKTWRPTQPYLGGFAPVLMVGRLIHLLDGTPNADVLIAKVVESIVTAGGYEPDTLSELHVGALLKKLGGEVAFVSRSSVRTPDLTARWGGQLLDVEVTRGEWRQVHEAHMVSLRELADSIGRSETASHAVFIAVLLDDDLIKTLTDTVATTGQGERIESAGQWCVVGGAAQDGDKFVDPSYLDFLAPDWWGESRPSIDNVTRGLGATSNSTVHIRTRFPLAHFVNSIRNKAERLQRTGEHPFVIALDTLDMPAVESRLPKELDGFLELWPDVSAIMLVRPVFPSFDGQHWRTWLIANPNAAKSLPPSFVRMFGSNEKIVQADW